MQLVSVIIPTYKRNIEMLERAILSVVNQTYKNIEILLIDDNIENYFSGRVQEAVCKINDDRIVLIKNEQNIGGAASRNKGGKIASGYYISFLDDDDFYISDKIEKQVSYIEKYDDDFIISNLAIVDENYKLKDIRNYKWFENNYKNEQLIIEHYKYHLTGTPTFLFKKEMFIKIGGFPQVNIGHEFFLVNNALESNFQLGYLNKTLSVAVNHDGERISNNKNRQKDLNNLLKFKIHNKKNIKTIDKRRIYHRHYLAKAFAYFNSKDILYMLWCLTLSIWYGPKAFFEEGVKRMIIKIQSRSILNDKIK